MSNQRANVTKSLETRQKNAPRSRQAHSRRDVGAIPTTPLDLARQAWADHIRDCTYCRQGRPCDVGDPLDRRLTEAASGDLPWPDTSFQIDNNSENR